MGWGWELGEGRAWGGLVSVGAKEQAGQRSLDTKRPTTPPHLTRTSNPSYHQVTHTCQHYTQWRQAPGWRARAARLHSAARRTAPPLQSNRGEGVWG